MNIKKDELAIEKPQDYDNGDEYMKAVYEEAQEIWDEYIEENKELN